MNVFLAGTSFNDNYGGPAVSIANLACGLAKVGAAVTVWAPDGSAPSNPVLTGQSGVTPAAGRLQEVMNAARTIDLVHDNGIWLPHNHRLAQVCKSQLLPRVVSVRGMLQGWAFRYKGAKKRVAWEVYQRRDLRTAACLHATSDSEAAHVRSYGLRVPVEVIPNGIEVGGSPVPRPWRQPDLARTALFLGRIHPIKGLASLIHAWAVVRPDAWKLRIVGPDEVGHVSELRALAESLGVDRVVSFEPPIARRGIPALLRASDLLVLCSHSENFGMSVVEALLQEVPVLTSWGTPWRSVADERCGWWVENNVTSLAEGLREATALTPVTLHEMGCRGRKMVKREFSSNRVAERFLTLYAKLITAAREKH